LARKGCSKQWKQTMVGPPEDFLLFFAEIKIPEGFVRRFQQTPAQFRLKGRLDEQLVYSWFGQVGCILRQTVFPPQEQIHNSYWRFRQSRSGKTS
jgi:hypothetical protein